jgi:hypothetical protein
MVQDGGVDMSASGETEPDNAILERFKSEATSNCAALFIEDLFLIGGHDASTRNATATFITFNGRYYACTCRHAVELVQRRREAGHSPFPTLALFFDKTYIPLSFLTAEGLEDAISIVTPEANEEYMDLAIADISSIWPQLNAFGKVAIEMNSESYANRDGRALKCLRPRDGLRLTSVMSSEMMGGNESLERWRL